MTQFDCITIGDISLDRFIVVKGIPQSPSDVNPGNFNIMLELGQKIPVDKVKDHIGGNACNVAVGMNKLGSSVALYSHIGTDYIAQVVLQSLRDLNIPESLIVQEENQTTNSATIISMENDRVVLSYHAPRTYTPQPLPSSNWLYLTSLGKGCESIIHQCLREKSDHNRKLAFNPGSFAMKHQLELIRSLLHTLDILIVNKEESQIILGTNEEDISNLLKELNNKIAGIPIITNGADGGYAFEDNSIIHQQGVILGELIETTGAGDAFSSGFLHAYLQGKTLAEALVYGAINSGSVITKIGATNGLLQEKTILEFLPSYANLT